MKVGWGLKDLVVEVLCSPFGHQIPLQLPARWSINMHGEIGGDIRVIMAVRR